jgi:polysaccharide pyruvyl transferase WcaK-like protein
MMSGYAVNDGPAFHTAVASEIEKATGRRLPVWKGSLSAAELKWGISRLDVFAGGRMHSTIAALSSCVPTLSLAYSVKALGITQDVYGTLRYCLPPEKLEAREMSRAILALISEADEVRGHLKRVMPDMIQRSLNAGRLLRQVMEGRGKV